MMFNNNNGNPNPFGSNQPNNMFNNQNTQPNNPMANNPPSNMFSNNLNNNTQNNAFRNPTGNNNPFNTNQQNSAPMFGNNAGNNAPAFGNNPLFPNTNNNNTGNNMFNNTNNTNNSGPMFTQGNPLFNRSTQQNTNQPPFMGTNTQGTPVLGQTMAFQQNLQNTKMQLQECVKRLIAKNIESIRLDSWNLFKDRPVNKLEYKNEILKIMYNFQELQKTLKNLKQANQNIQTKLSNFSKQTYKKLALYKKCLLQTVSHNKLIEQVSSELDMMNKQIQQYFKPLYNAYKTKKRISIKQPNQFDIKISYDVLNKLELLNQKVDDMIACQITNTDEEVENTIVVFEQLVQYYQNVSCSFKEFSQKYNDIKRNAIEKDRRGSYDMVMSKVRAKVQENFKKEFKYYDLIKEIDQLISQKDKREEKRRLEGQNKYESLISRKTF